MRAANGTAADVRDGRHDPVWSQFRDKGADGDDVGKGVKRPHLVEMDHVHGPPVRLGLRFGDHVVNRADIFADLVRKGQSRDALPDFGKTDMAMVRMIVGVIMMVAMVVGVIMVFAMVVDVIMMFAMIVGVNVAVRLLVEFVNALNLAVNANFEKRSGDSAALGLRNRELHAWDAESAKTGKRGLGIRHKFKQCGGEHVAGSTGFKLETKRFHGDELKRRNESKKNGQWRAP